MKSLDVSISTSGQSSVYKELLDMAGVKVRISIKSDSYQNQCYARVSRWNGEDWKIVDHIPSANMKTANKLAYRPTASTKADFRQDRKELWRLANLVLA